MKEVNGMIENLLLIFLAIGAGEILVLIMGLMEKSKLFNKLTEKFLIDEE